MKKYSIKMSLSFEKLDHAIKGTFKMNRLFHTIIDMSEETILNEGRRMDHLQESVAIPLSKLLESFCLEIAALKGMSLNSFFRMYFKRLLL